MAKKPKIRTKIKSQLRIVGVYYIVASSIAVAVTLGITMGIGSFNIMKLYSLSYFTGSPVNAVYSSSIESIAEFNQLQVSLDDNINDLYIYIGRRGPYTVAIVPKQGVADSCASLQCLSHPLFINLKNPISVISQLYPESDWENNYNFCIVQKLRQYPNEKFGFECEPSTELLFDYRNIMSLEETAGVYDLLRENIPFTDLVYAPDFFKSSQINLTKSWSQAPFEIFYETHWLNNIESAERLTWLLGTNLEEISFRPILFFAPKPGIDDYCGTLGLPDGRCLDTTLYTAAALNIRLFTHATIIKYIYPEQFGGAGDVEQFLDYSTGQYQRGIIWKKPGENFIRFQINGTVSLESLRQANQSLQTFRAGQIVFSPSPSQESLIRGWIAALPAGENLGFPVAFSTGLEDVSYQAYNSGTNYGRIKLIRNESDLANVTWQDFLILDYMPRDIVSPVAGTITAEQQFGGGGHLMARAAQRNTPNAYVKNAATALQQHIGKLMKVEIGLTGYTFSPATEDEAGYWWLSHRPHLPPPTPINPFYSQFLNFNNLADDPQATGLFSRFGGKGGNLANLYKTLPAENQAIAFGIPFYYYLNFIRTDNYNYSQTYAEYIDTLLSEPRFITDSFYRNTTLTDLYSRIRDYGNVDDRVTEQLIDKIAGLWNTDAIGKNRISGKLVTVRFRSSSNMEDNLGFNGAGLYESTSVCLADSLYQHRRSSMTSTQVNYLRSLCKKPDEDSFCDCTENKRTVERGLLKVWASLWLPKAFNEREYYQLPQNAAMAILVNTATDNELANGVAYTGYTEATNYQHDSNLKDYVINVQFDEESVVSPEPGTNPEIDIIRMYRYPSAPDSVHSIIRSLKSSLAGQNGRAEYVLTDDQLNRLGRVIQGIDSNNSFENEGYPEEQIIKDIEFKFLPGGVILIKQLRSFLKGGAMPYDETADFVPPTPANFRTGLQNGYAVLNWDTTDNVSQQIIERQFENIDKNEIIAIVGSQISSFTDLTSKKGISQFYQITAENRSGKSTPSGQEAAFTPCTASSDCHWLNGEYPTGNIRWQTRDQCYEISEELYEFRNYTCVNTRCEYAKTSEQWKYNGEDRNITDGTPCDDNSKCTSNDACSFGACRGEFKNCNDFFIDVQDCNYPDDGNPRTFDFYNFFSHCDETTGECAQAPENWQNLITHQCNQSLCQAECYRYTDFCPPTTCSQDGCVGKDFYNYSEKTNFCQSNCLCQKNTCDPPQISVNDYRCTQAQFKRGNANNDNSIDIADAIFIFNYLFTKGNNSPVTCLDAMDINDSGKVNIADPVYLLNFLFRGEQDPAAPFDACGYDYTPDDLTCDSNASCE